MLSPDLLVDADVPAPPVPARRRRLLALLAAALVGVGAGALTFGLERLEDAPAWFGFWHGLAPWGVVAAVVGAGLPGRCRAAAVAGALVQVGLVTGYYTLEMVSLGTVSTNLAVYMAVAVAAGPFYGASGALLGGPEGRARTVASGVLAAPWLADGCRDLLEDVSGTGSPSVLAVAVGVLVVGAVLPLALNRSLRAGFGGLGTAALVAALILALEELPLG
ncbi:DUF6518 family protein [Actinomadura harenae]|nr:DUF6518 family protein [Actinomadura harenae]